MMKRLALLLSALFVASMVLVAPVFASGNHEDKNNGGDNEKVCVLHKNKGDDHNNGDKDYRWVSEDGNHHGDKVVKDKYCKDKNGDHENNNNGDHHANGNNDDDGDHHANNYNDDNGNADDDDNGNANDDDEDRS